VATSPTSYLQTLSKAEAIAFVASLQKVKDHLSHEIQWLSEQSQQKTSQIQGIETLLSEAVALGLITTITEQKVESTPVAVPPPVLPPEVAIPSVIAEASEANGSTLPEMSTDSIAAAIAALPAKQPTKGQPRGRQSKAGGKETSQGQKTPTQSKTGSASAKQSTPSSSTSKAGQRGKPSNLQRFLQGSFRDQTLTQSVGEILNRAAAPLTADDVMAELYDGLSKSDYQRAKNSVTNILSVGRTKGAWKSSGRGRYASNAVAT